MTASFASEYIARFVSDSWTADSQANALGFPDRIDRMSAAGRCRVPRDTGLPGGVARRIGLAADSHVASSSMTPRTSPAAGCRLTRKRERIEYIALARTPGVLRPTSARPGMGTGKTNATEHFAHCR